MEYTEKTVTLKSGRTCLIRRPEEADAEALLEYLKTTAGETPYLIRGPEEVRTSLEEEVEFIRRNRDDPRGLMLLAFVDGQLAGPCSFAAVNNRNRTRHRCAVGIALYQKFWGMGIGTALLGEILDMAKSAGYEQAELEVVSANAPAAALYRAPRLPVWGRNLRGFPVHGENAVREPNPPQLPTDGPSPFRPT